MNETIYLNEVFFPVQYYVSTGIFLPTVHHTVELWATVMNTGIVELPKATLFTNSLFTTTGYAVFSLTQLMFRPTFP